MARRSHGISGRFNSVSGPYLSYYGTGGQRLVKCGTNVSGAAEGPGMGHQSWLKKETP